MTANIDRRGHRRLNGEDVRKETSPEFSGHLPDVGEGGVKLLFVKKGRYERKKTLGWRTTDGEDYGSGKILSLS